MNRRRQPFLVAPSSVAADPDGFRAALVKRGQAFGAVRGDSMTPTLLDGDVVLVVPVAEVRRGQVLAFEDAHGKVITHRAVRVDERSVICRGDNRDRRDAAVPRAAVIGRVVEAVGGAPLVDSGFRLAVLQAWLLGRRVLHPRRRLGRLLGELALLRRQRRGAAVWSGPLGDGGFLGASGDDVVLRGGDVGLDGGLVPGPERRQDGRIVVPAAVFCRLAPRSREALLGAFHGRAVTVFAFARPARGVLLRSMAGVRAAARRSGRDWGSPGDAVMGDGSGATVHLYRAEELEAEVGGRLGAVGVTSSGPPFLLLKAETSSPARRGEEAGPATAR